MNTRQLLLFASLLGASLTGCAAAPGDGDTCAVDDAECIRAACTVDGVLDLECVSEQCRGDQVCIAAVANGAPEPGDVGSGTGLTSTPEAVRATCAVSNVGPRLLRRLSRGEVEATLVTTFPELLGAGWEGVRLSEDTTSPIGFTTDASVLVVSGPMARELLKTAEEVAATITSAAVLPTVLSCAADATPGCAAEFVNNYGVRLFRRPLTQEEVKRYTDYHASVAARSDFVMGLKWTLVALLESPHSIYRTELGEPTGDGSYGLTQYELASNLAYTYTGAPPDRTLLDKAAAGELSSPDALRAEANRLLDTGMSGGRGWNTTDAFFEDWIEYQRVRGQSRDDDPNFAVETTPLMIEETRRFLRQVVFGDGGNVTTLMNADFTAMNAALTEFYGFGSVTNGDWDRVIRPAGQGVGILAQGSLMASTSHQAETSPTLRGLMIYERLLCNTKPKVPDIVPSIEATAPAEGTLTTRQRFEEHHSQGTCGSCHKPFEPFGYVVESFDELGRYRSMDNGLPVNTATTVTLPDGAQVEITDLEALGALVNTTDHIENCVSGMMAAYLLSGAGGTNCLAEESRAALARGEISLRDYIVSLAAAPHFSTRR